MFSNGVTHDSRHQSMPGVPEFSLRAPPEATASSPTPEAHMMHTLASFQQQLKLSSQMLKDGLIAVKNCIGSERMLNATERYVLVEGVIRATGLLNTRYSAEVAVKAPRLNQLRQWAYALLERDDRRLGFQILKVDGMCEPTFQLLHQLRETLSEHEAVLTSLYARVWDHFHQLPVLCVPEAIDAWVRMDPSIFSHQEAQRRFPSEPYDALHSQDAIDTAARTAHHWESLGLTIHERIQLRELIADNDRQRDLHWNNIAPTYQSMREYTKQEGGALLIGMCRLSALREQYPWLARVAQAMSTDAGDDLGPSAREQ